ncbi:MAG: SpoIID/LytB domain-containing protein, partial [Anaerolineae bacterium]
MKRALFPAGIFLAATLLFPRTAVAGDPLPPGRRYPSPDGNATAVLATLPFRAEVWLIEGGGPPRLALRADGETFSELAWQPGGQSFTVVRTPLGTETAAWGALWRYHLPSDRALPVDEHYAAHRLPHKTAPPLPRRATAGANLSPPDTIRVKHHPSNTCRSVPVGQIDAIPFEEYVKRVVPAEVFPSWPENTLKAQAVAARTYAWHQILIHQSWDFDVTDWVDYQAMCDLTTPATDAAVAATRGQYLAYNGQVILAMYSAENGSPTKTNPAAPYLQAVDDPVSFGQPRLGHGYGMGQWGAQRWAARHNWSYQAILRHYYSGVTVEQGAAPTGDAPPNVSLVAPWADHYRTGNKLRLVANTTDDGGVISYTAIYLAAPLTPTLLFSVTGPAPPQGFVLDVSGWADRSLLDGGLVFTALAVDGSGKRSVS